MLLLNYRYLLEEVLLELLEAEHGDVDHNICRHRHPSLFHCRHGLRRPWFWQLLGREKGRRGWGQELARGLARVEMGRLG